MSDYLSDPEEDQSDDQSLNFDEEGFKDWYTSWADTTGMDPNPDDPRHFYDFRAAYENGVEPVISPVDGKYHWDSRYKADDHPNRFIDGVDTKTGEALPDPEVVGEINKPEEPPVKEASAEAPRKPVVLKEEDFEPDIEKEPVVLKEEDFEGEGETVASGFNPWESSMARLSKHSKSPDKGLSPEAIAAKKKYDAEQAEARRIKQEEANRAAAPLISAYFAHLAPDAIRNTDTFNSAAAGAAMDEAGIIWERRRQLALEGKDISKEELARLEWLDKISEYSSTAEGWGAFLPSAGQLVGQQINAMFSNEMNPFSTTALSVTAAAGVAAATSGPLALVTVPAAMAAAGSATMAAMQFQRAKAVEGGQAFKEVQEWTDENGKTIDKKTAAVIAGIIGDINGALELAGFESGLAMLSGLKALKGGIRPMLKESAVLRKGLIKMAKEYLTGVVGETGTEVLQEMPAIAGKALFQGENLVDALTDEAARLDYEETAKKVAPGMGLLGLFGAGGHALGIRGDMKQQAQNIKFIMPMTEHAANLFEAGLATGNITQDQVATYYVNAKEVWPDNPVLPRLEAMLSGFPTEEAGPSLYTPADDTDISGLKSYLTSKLPDGTEIDVEPSTERKGMGEIQRVGDQTGTKVRFYKAAGEADQLNGLYDDNTGTIWVNESAENPFMVVLGHETVHKMRTEQPELYQQLSDFAKGKEIGFDEYMASLNERRKERGLEAITPEDAMGREEFLGDFVGEQFKSSEFWAKVNKIDPDMGQKLARYVNELIEKIKVLFNGRTEYVTDLEEMQDALAKTYVEFGRRKGDGKVQVMDSSGQWINPKVQDLTEQTVGQKIIGAIETALSPGAAEARSTSGVKSGKSAKAAPKVVVLKEEDFGPPVAPEAQGEAQAEEAPKDQGEKTAPPAAPAGETEQAEFDRLWGELKPEERKLLADIPKDDEMSIDEKITFVKAEMAKRTSVQEKEKKATPFQYQNTNQEKVIHSTWEKGNNYRFMLEGSGDIFRELAKGSPDAGYIREKIKRILAHIAEEERGIHEDDSFKTSSKANKAYFDKMRQQWKDQPVTNDLQEKARQLNLAMLDGDFETVASLIDEITGKQGPVTAYTKEVQDYRRSNQGRAIVPEELEEAWEHIKSQTAPEWFGPGQWSRKEFDELVAKVDGGKKLTYNQFQRFQDLIKVMDDVNRNDKELAAKVATQATADALEEKGWTPVNEERPADSIPEGAQVQIDGKVYKQNGINDDGYIHLKGEEDLLLEPYENVKIEGLKGGKSQKDDIAASLKKNDFEIDVVAMDEQGNTAMIKAKASEAVAENYKQQEFARRLLECLNS